MLWQNGAERCKAGVQMKNRFKQVFVTFTCIFEDERINAEKWWIDLKNIKMHCDGYEYLSRGMLVGFVISSGV